jgi:hypothetical protein
MRWEVKEMEDGKWGIFLCEGFWRYPDKPVCYSVSVDEHGARQRVGWMNAEQEKLEANPEEHDDEPEMEEEVDV